MYSCEKNLEPITDLFHDKTAAIFKDKTFRWRSEKFKALENRFDKKTIDEAAANCKTLVYDDKVYISEHIKFNEHTVIIVVEKPITDMPYINLKNVEHMLGGVRENITCLSNDIDMATFIIDNDNAAYDEILKIADQLQKQVFASEKDVIPVQVVLNSLSRIQECRSAVSSRVELFNIKNTMKKRLTSIEKEMIPIDDVVNCTKVYKPISDKENTAITDITSLIRTSCDRLSDLGKMLGIDVRAYVDDGIITGYLNENYLRRIIAYAMEEVALMDCKADYFTINVKGGRDIISIYLSGGCYTSAQSVNSKKFKKEYIEKEISDGIRSSKLFCDKYNGRYYRVKNPSSLFVGLELENRPVATYKLNASKSFLNKSDLKSIFNPEKIIFSGFEDLFDWETDPDSGKKGKNI